MRGTGAPDAQRAAGGGSRSKLRTALNKGRSAGSGGARAPRQARRRTRCRTRSAFRCWLVAMLDRSTRCRRSRRRRTSNSWSRPAGSTPSGRWPRSRSSPAISTKPPGTCARSATGSTGTRTTTSSRSSRPRLGRVLCALGRYDEAEPLAGGAGAISAMSRMRSTNPVAAGAAARLRESRQHDEAERLPRSGGDRDNTDSLVTRPRSAATAECSRPPAGAKTPPPRCARPSTATSEADHSARPPRP